MVKRIIFDLDNTLLMWKKEYIFALKKVLEEFGYLDCLKQIDEVIDNYDQNNISCSKTDFLDYVNLHCQTDFKVDFVDALIKEQGNCYEKNVELEQLLAYLSNKYELYVLSNWFTDVQIARLKNAEILKYFKVVSGGDMHPLKPALQAFENMIKDIDVKECLMIGDSFKADIEPALKLGLNVIWVTNDNSSICKTVKNVLELKNIL